MFMIYFQTSSSYETLAIAIKPEAKYRINDTAVALLYILAEKFPKQYLVSYNVTGHITNCGTLLVKSVYPP
jgi:hypothetical protein